MDIVERKVENQVQFWSLIGPFFVLLSIAVLLFKVSTHWYFPVSALIGIPLCVKWKMKGMAAALGCLLLLAGIGYQDLELDDRYWHVGLSLAMAFSLIVLTLSLEEVQGLVGKLQLESQSRLDNFLLLDEKWKGAEQEWSIERERAKTEIVSLTHDFAKTQEDKQTFYKLAQLAKDELVQVRGQHDQLLQDLLYKKQQIAQFHERLEETELTIQGFVNSDVEKKYQALTEQLASLEREKETWKAKVALAQSEKQSCLQEKEQVQQELHSCQEREKLSCIDQQRIQQDKVEQKNALHALQHKCLVLEQERNALSQAQMVLQQQCEQMRHVEAQQRQTVQQSQLKIYDLEIKAAAEKQQKEALLRVRQEIEELLIHQEIETKQREEHYHTQLQQLQNQLSEKEKAEAELKHIQQQTAQQNQQERQALEQEIQALQERYQKAQESLLQANQSLDMTQQALIQVKQEEATCKIQLQHLQQQLDEHAKKADTQSKLILGQEKQQAQQKQITLEQEKALQERYHKVQEDLVKVRQELEAKNEACVYFQQKVEKLSAELKDQHVFVQQNIDHMQKLENLKLQLEQTLQQTQAQLQSTKQKVETEHRQHEKLPYAPGNTRRIEAMYIQLEEQFQEKCTTLDGTRRELFHVQEELLKLQKERQEEHIFDQSLDEQYLQHHLHQVGQHYEHMQQQYQQEIDDLTQLVKDLLHQTRS